MQKLLAGLGRVLTLIVVIGVTPFDAADAQVRAGGEPEGLTAFRSDADLSRFLRRQRERQARRQSGVPAFVPPPPASAPPSAMVFQMEADVQEVVVTGSRIEDPSITNTQEVGVDEGGIVKVRGDILVILRRGRLFTVSTADGALRPVASINAYPPGVDARADWYDEMLISGDQIIVIGFSYGRGGTEINRFTLGADGSLAFRDAYHLRSNDYYSSRNYASRLIGHELIFYTPLYLEWEHEPLEALPGLRRWTGEADGAFRRITGGQRVYVAPRASRPDDEALETLHTVTRCDLSTPTLTCEATGVLGQDSRTFYVSPEAVYLWTSADAWSRPRRPSESSLFRIPLDGRRPQAVLTHGNPIDQFSFREDRRRGRLDVLVVSEGGGDAMWRPEFAEGRPALLSVPLNAFGAGTWAAPRRAYRILEAVPDGGRMLNRFIGDTLLYSGTVWKDESDRPTGRLFAVDLNSDAVVRFNFEGAVSRIESLGGDALAVVERAKSLDFNALALAGPHARIISRYALRDAAEAEGRSHAFFYSPDPASPDGATGLLGLPAMRTLRNTNHAGIGVAADMIFLARRDRQLSPLGELVSRPENAVDDGCMASCVDWYGDARPIFLRGRVFALLGYEMVEGEVVGARIVERRRSSFAPTGTGSSPGGIDE